MDNLCTESLERAVSFVCTLDANGTPLGVCDNIITTNKPIHST